MKRIIFIFAPILFFACGQGPYHRIGNWGHMMGYGGGFMWIIFLIVVGILIYFLLQASKSNVPDNDTVEKPLDILKKRYAKGEINKEEFEKMKNDIES